MGRLKQIENLGVTFAQIFIVVFLLFTFFNNAFELPYNRKIPAGLAILSIVSMYPTWIKKRTIIPVIMGVLTIFYAMYWGFSYERLWYMNRDLYSSIIAVTIGFLLINSRVSRWTFYIPVTIIFITVLFSAPVLKEPIRGSNFYGINRNVLAKYVFTFAILNTIKDGIDSIRYPHIAPPVFSSVVAWYSQSRAGLILSILLVLLVMGTIGVRIIQNRQPSSQNNFFTKKSMFIILAVFLLILISFFIYDSRIVESGLDSNGRMSIIRSFFEELTFTKFLTGFKPTAIEPYYSLHNSILDLVASSGVSAFIMFGLVIGGWFRLKGKSLLLSILLVLLVIYAQVEHYIFIRMGDLALYPLIMYAYKDFTFPKLKRKASTS